jgi:hypothetical protein
MFTCDKCGRDFAKSSTYKSHQNRKNPCVKPIPENLPKNTCEWCGHTLSSSSSFSRHKNVCIVKKNKGKLDEIRKAKEERQRIDKMTEAFEAIDKRMQNITDENQKLIKMIEELKNDKQQVDINYKSKYIQNNVVIINNAISPNTDFISKEMVGDMLDNHKLNAPIFLTAEIYYGDRPENHSLHITNQKTTEGVAYRNGVWVPLKRTDIQAYLLNGLYTSYDKIIQLGRNIDRYSNDVLLSEIERNQHDDKNIANEIRSLIFLAVQTAKKNDISLNFIEEDIKRGRAALKMIDGVLVDNATDNKHGKEEV